MIKNLNTILYKVSLPFSEFIHETAVSVGTLAKVCLS